MIAYGAVYAVLRRLLSNRGLRAPKSIGADTALGDLLGSETDWQALQRGVYRNLGCFIPLEELRALRTVRDLAHEVKVRVDRGPVDTEPAAADTHEFLRGEDSEAQLYQIVRVYYATDRARGASSAHSQQYKSKRGDGTLALGSAEVAIPHSHRFGELEGPPWWQWFRSPDPRRHITVLVAREFLKNAFWDSVRTCIASSSAQDALLLVHGYNVSFDNGLRRAAQIVKDLNFLGAPILYSWPSHASVASYSADEGNVEWTTPHLRTFLRDLLADAGARQVHVIAHSLGNRAVVAAIRELRLDTLPSHAAQLCQLVLAAPDMDAGTFRELAAEFAHKPKRCTLYANSEDRALAASEWKHGGYSRAGGGGDDLVVVPMVDTIDATGHATDFLSHSYYAASSPLINDLFYVIRTAAPPDDRSRLERRELAGLSYWRIKQ